MLVSGPSTRYGRPGTLDAQTYEALVRRSNRAGDLASLGFPTSGKITVPGNYSMWVADASDQEESSLTLLVTIPTMGLVAGGEKRKRFMSVAGREVAIGPDDVVVLAWTTEENGSEANGDDLEDEFVKRRVPKVDSNGDPVYKVITTPLGTWDRWNVREPILVVTDTYFTTSQPDMTKGGTALAPPNPPSPPPFVWGGYTEPLRKNYPTGWVLDDRRPEEHFKISNSNGLWEVTDVFGYYHAAIPD